MPGSIQVTVLEAVDLPSETTDGEYVSVKVFVGKREFQTNPSQATGGVTTPWNIDFAFPVLNLRDHLEVILLDSNGDQIGRNEIETPSIVERGLCDEFFPLKGSGRIHLRLCFVLTDEERKRIEVMRASALKRKQQETSNNGEFQALQPVVEKGKDSPVSTTAVIGERPQEETIIESKENNVAGSISVPSENPSGAAPDEEKPAVQLSVKEEDSQSVMNTVGEQRKESLGLESEKMPGNATPMFDQMHEVKVESQILAVPSDYSLMSSTSSKEDPFAIRLESSMVQKSSDAEMEDQNLDGDPLSSQSPSVSIKPVVETVPEVVQSSDLEIKVDSSGCPIDLKLPLASSISIVAEESGVENDQDVSASETGLTSAVNTIGLKVAKTPSSLQEGPSDEDRSSNTSTHSSMWPLQPSKNDSILPTPSVNLSLDASEEVLDTKEEEKTMHSSPDQTEFSGSTFSSQKEPVEGTSLANLSPSRIISAHNSSTEPLTESSLTQSTPIYSAAPAGDEASNEYSADEASFALQKHSRSSKGDSFVHSMLDMANHFPEKEQSEHSTPLMPYSQVESNDTLLPELPLTDLSVPDQEAAASAQPSMSAPLVQPLAHDAAWNDRGNPNEGSNLGSGTGETSILISDHIPSHVAVTPTSHLLCSEGVSDLQTSFSEASESSPVTPNRAEASRLREEEVVGNLKNAEEKEMEEKKGNTELDGVRRLVREEELGELNSQITSRQMEQEASGPKLMEHKIMGDLENAEILSCTTDAMNDKQKQKEHKSQNSQNSVNMVKQLFGGAVVIVAGALFMWSRAGNDNKRSPTMSKSISHAEGRNASPIQSRST